MTQLREAYLSELLAMLLVLFIGIAWLTALVCDYVVARRAERQLLGEVEMHRGFRGFKRLGLRPRGES
jgi:hypothetical protein